MFLEYEKEIREDYMDKFTASLESARRVGFLSDKLIQRVMFNIAAVHRPEAIRSKTNADQTF